MRRIHAFLCRPAWALAGLLALGLPARADEPPPEPAPAPAPEAPAAPHDADLMFDPRFREGRPSDPLAPGERPLLRGTLDAFVDLVEGSMEVALLPDEEQQLRDAIETAWPKATEAERQWFDDQARRRAELRTMLATGASPEVVRQKLAEAGGAIDARLAHDPKGAWHAILLAVRARRDEVLAPGTPPISRADVEALESLVDFLVCVARNDGTAPTSGQHEQERAALLETMAKSGALVRGRYDRMHRLWLIAKARWDAADDIGRLRLRGAVLMWFRPLAGLGPVERGLALDLRTYAALAAEVRAKLSVFDAYHGAITAPGKAIEVLLEGLGLDPKAVDTAFETPSLSLR
jgi:hypothetical protein